MCFRCQRYGHSSDLCTLDFMCVKCSGIYPNKNCEVLREQIKCANCSQNSCANYFQCPRIPIVIRVQKALTIKDAPIRKGDSFAAATSNIQSMPAKHTTTQQCAELSLLNQLDCCFPWCWKYPKVLELRSTWCSYCQNWKDSSTINSLSTELSSTLGIFIFLNFTSITVMTGQV